MQRSHKGGRRRRKEKKSLKMVMLCFLLDLRSLSPTLLRDLKQSLLQLSNYYAVSSSRISDSCDSTKSSTLSDCIGLCYVVRNRISGSDELKIAYRPQGKFSLRDFHHALNTLPTDASPDSNDFGALGYLILENVLDAIIAWKGQIKRKVIVISSSLVKTMDRGTELALADAVNMGISVEFVFLDKKSSHSSDATAHVNDFEKLIGDFKNCKSQTCTPDPLVLFGLAKRWYQELKADMEEPIQARFIFRTDLVTSLNHISCNLCTSYKPITDGFTFCQTCWCHGVPLSLSNSNQNKKNPVCPITNSNLEDLDICENSVKVGEQTILNMPSFQCSEELHKVSSPIDFNVIKRTHLGSLSEGVIVGASYNATPSTFHHTDDSENAELNTKLFRAVCSVLNSLDQGLVCSSNCNIETAMETSFKCYYILLPSDIGPMLLRRLLASEEFFPFPDVSQFINSDAVYDAENTVKESLLTMEVDNYNPFHHERGFHKKLNSLVKQSLQIGVIDLPQNTKPNLTQQVSSPDVRPLPERPVIFLKDDPVIFLKREEPPIFLKREETSQPDSETTKVETNSSLTKEWEQLIVEEKRSSPSIPNSKPDQMTTSPSCNNRKLDEKTSRILERLENPKQIKRKTVSPGISSSFPTDLCGPVKKPLIPDRPITIAHQSPVVTQPMKPNFQRKKRG